MQQLLPTRRIFLGGLASLAATSVVRGDVNLVTIPRREGTQLTIYNSVDVTMVRESRLLTLKKGINRIQFTWANTLIDPTSIDFRILDKQDEINLLDTTFPAGRNDALQWNIDSELAGKVPIEIRYFTSGITWSADYVGIANRDETTLRLTGYVRVFNHSGEEYENAETRLVVGNINLVEKIADLAGRPPPIAENYLDFAEKDRSKLRADFDDSVKLAEELAAGGKGGGGEMPLEGKKGVVKQGLSEYFLFAIEGREEIKDKEPKRLVALEVREAPLEVLYKLTDRDGGAQFSKFYRFQNTKLLDKRGKEQDVPAMENLGLSPLPNGDVRLFFEYANKDLAYVGGTTTKYVPIGDRLEVNVGTDPDITIAHRLKDHKTTNVVSRQYKRRESDDIVVLYDLIDYDETLYYEDEIVNGKSKPVKVEIERHADENVVLWSLGEPPADWKSDEPGAYVDLHTIIGVVERVDQNHYKYFLDLAPGERRIVSYTVTCKRRKVGPELNVMRKREPL
jgi:hypothetical protein